MNLTQCKSERMIHGRVERCEGLQGHASAHFCDQGWWPNPEGLPTQVRRLARSHWFEIVLWVFVAVCACAVIWWMLTRGIHS